MGSTSPLDAGRVAAVAEPGTHPRMKSIQLAWHPGTARFEATGTSAHESRSRRPASPARSARWTVPHGPAAGPSPAELLLVGAPAAPPGTWSRSCASAPGPWPRSTSPWMESSNSTHRGRFGVVELRFTVRGRGLDRRHVGTGRGALRGADCSVLSTIREPRRSPITTLVVEESPVRGRLTCAGARRPRDPAARRDPATRPGRCRADRTSGGQP